VKFGVYIHIPYCEKRCSYCDFPTYSRDLLPPLDDYCHLLCEEIQRKSHTFSNYHAETLYFGGGTPSLLSPKQIEKILNKLNQNGQSTNHLKEFTIETNPNSLTREKLDDFKSLGVTRVSLGVQTFSDSLLQRIGRIHSAEQAKQGIQLLQKVDLKWSLDLLYALPEQTIQCLSDDLNTIKSFSPSHISAYCLTIDQDHPLYTRLPNEEMQAQMVSLVTQRLTEMGLSQYEISNFSKPGFECLHNQFYWNLTPTWGLGLGAHSYFDKTYKAIANDHGVRTWNPSSFEDYARIIENDAQQPHERLKEHESLTDFCYVSLRTQQGLSLKRAETLFSPRYVNQILPRLKDSIGNGLVVKEAERLFLTPKGTLLSNTVFQTLTFGPED
jgi:oxygen-independent coproporphyrinogen-3 oxidase